jgi:choline transport protein
LTILGWLAGLTSVAFLLATMIQSVALFNNPTYEPQRWQATLIMIAFGGVATLGNTFGKRFLPIFETIAGALHVYDLSYL